MVREFAASGGLLRENENFALHHGRAWPDRDRIGLSIIIVVAIFLLAATISVTQQLAQSRHEQLAASQRTLSLAIRLVAAEIGAGQAGTNIPASEIPSRFPSLPDDLLTAGTRYFLIDGAGIVRAETAFSGHLGRSFAELLADRIDYTRLARAESVTQSTLADGTETRLSVRAIPNLGAWLVALQAVDDVLLPWKRKAWIIAGIFLTFIAVTIAFTLAFLALRSRIAVAGSTTRRLKSQFEIAMDYGRCGLWDWTFTSSRILWSSSMHRILGEASEEGMTARDLAARLHPDDATLLDEIRDQVTTGAGDLDRLFRMRHNRGGWVWLRMRAVAIDDDATGDRRLVGMVMDVTREREADEDIRRSDAHLRDAIESISEAFVLWDEANRLVLCNSKYQSFHGLPSGLVRRGAAYSDLMAAARQPHLLNEIDRASETGNGARCYEAQFSDGRWLLISERHTRDGGYVSVGTDITARKAQEEKLLLNERQLRMTIADLQSSREALRKRSEELTELADRYLEQKAEATSASRAKSEFLANMNHEIRTPLNHIIGFADMIESEIYGPCGSTRYVEYARDIRESGASLLATISDILDMAQIEAGRLSLSRAPIAIAALLARAVEQVREAADAKRIEIEIDPDMNDQLGGQYVTVDMKSVSHALAHLLRSGIRLSPTGGKVSLRARLGSDHLNIFVADTGCALSARALGTMADPFGHIDEMLQDGCKGSGLGISISRALIELHGGTIRLRSAPNIGSLVMVRLPAGLQPMQLEVH